ncbi:hypothetical protein SO802_001911 [Lithocarpus litseifolius]|uniref:Uncharacterized protein n=1 Tax=Lithocarpus litseifolius TaxID=425828 RepID=A0AAW2DVP9_9ROSI
MEDPAAATEDPTAADRAAADPVGWDCFWVGFTARPIPCTYTARRSELLSLDLDERRPMRQSGDLQSDERRRLRGDETTSGPQQAADG